MCTTSKMYFHGLPIGKNNNFSTCIDIIDIQIMTDAHRDTHRETGRTVILNYLKKKTFENHLLLYLLETSHSWGK